MLSRVKGMKRKKSQGKGGRLPNSKMNKTDNPSANAGIALTKEVREAIAQLPQVKSGQWSKSYLMEQVCRNLLGLKADYSLADLTIVFKGEVIE